MGKATGIYGHKKPQKSAKKGQEIETAKYSQYAEKGMATLQLQRSHSAQKGNWFSGRI
jgi:hypothetical protein